MEDRLLQLLESVLGKSKRTSGDNYAFYSPFVDHYKPKLEVNIKITSDGKKLRVSKSTWDEYNSIFSRVNRYNSDYQTDTIVEQVELPKEFKPLYKKSDSFKYKHALNYLLKRGLRPEDIIKYNIGYCETGEYEDKIIIPSYDSDGKLNFFVGRDFYNKLGYTIGIMGGGV